MSKFTLIALVVTLTLYGCTKKTTESEHLCTEVRSKRPMQMHFRKLNYLKEDVDTIIVNYYAHNNTFATILETATIQSHEVLDTLSRLFRSRTDPSFLEIFELRDYEVVVPTRHDTFRIHAGYRDDTEKYYSTQPCVDHGFFSYADTVYVNGASVDVEFNPLNQVSVGLYKF